MLAMKSRRREDEGPTIAQQCAASGCTCYCHKPATLKKGVFLLAIAVLILGLCAGASVPYIIWKVMDDAAKQQPHQTCDHMTSTGAQYDCHPDPPPVPEQIHQF